jgi:ribose/xylose/arabinose/galactoside ABC-type transport system permease subunit
MKTTTLKIVAVIGLCMTILAWLLTHTLIVVAVFASYYCGMFVGVWTEKFTVKENHYNDEN